MSARDPQTRIAELERELHWAQLRIQVLEERLRERRIALLGPRSETLSNLQLELLADEEPGVTADEVEAEAGREPVGKKPARERKPHPGRERLPVRRICHGWSLRSGVRSARARRAAKKWR